MAIPGSSPGGREAVEARLDSYQRLARVFHQVLSEENPDHLLELIGDTLAELIPYDALTIYEAREMDRILIPVLARDRWTDEVVRDRAEFGKGITGWAVEKREPVLANRAHADARLETTAETAVEPGALMSIPLVARGAMKGALDLHRLGENASFSEDEFELAKHFGDTVALALDNAERRVRLEREAKTDPLTGLYNHRFFHERLRAELNRAGRTRDAVAVMMVDIDDFKRVNDVFGHACGDHVLTTLAEIMSSTVRGSDVVCRLGGEEFGIILPSCDAGDALGLAARLTSTIARTHFDPVGKVTVSIGVAQGPEHAMNPRELVACADAAMLAAKERGKDRIVLFDDDTPSGDPSPRVRADVRSIAHLKMLQSLAGKLNRLNDVREIGHTIANELRTLIDYHSCLVYLAEGEALVPVAGRGELASLLPGDAEKLVRNVGVGIVGRAAETGRGVLVPNALECDFAVQVAGTPEIDESVLAMPLTYGSKVIGVISISALGVGSFDEHDVRLLEVLAGHASVALENARLYQGQRREADNAKTLLVFANLMSRATEIPAVGHEAVRFAGHLLGSEQASLWLQNERSGEFQCEVHTGYVGDPTAEAIIRARVPKQAGERLLTKGEDPFTLVPAEHGDYFTIPPGVVSRTLAIAPLYGLHGWITVRHPLPTGLHFSDDQLRLLAGIASQASLAIQRATLYKDQKENAEIASALLEFSRELAGAPDLEAVLASIVEQASRILGSPKTSVWMQHPSSGELAARAIWGYEGEQLERMSSLRIDRNLARAFLSGDSPFIFRPDEFENMSESLRGSVLFTDKPLFAVAPMRLDEERMGAVVTTAPALGDYEFSERKMRLLGGIAHQAKLAITNALSFESLEGTFLATVESLANALEAKDEYTSSHARWITDMALEVGKDLGIEGADLKRLELGALFHDIGKIGIPSDILSKPGPLTEEEWRVIRTHPELGEKILAPIDRLQDVCRIIRHCHEHYDGSGYPDGLRGEDIPLESRVILVVDAFHAMTSNRPYRKGMTAAKAAAILREEAGRQFDPAVVESFLSLLERNPALAVA